MIKHTIFRLLIVSYCSLLSTQALAILDINITQGVSGAINIAVVPFAWQGAGQNIDLAGIIRNNLTHSGEFRDFPVADMLQQPHQISDIDKAYWRRQGIDSLVIGQVQALDQDKVRVTVRLVDVFQARDKPQLPSAEQESGVLLQQIYVVNKNALRPLAHHVSDQIYQRMTGFKGAFSTRIAYVTVHWQNNKPDRYQLEIADADGYNPKPILQSKEPIMSPAWSPDGKQLAYVSFENRRAQIYISTVANGERRLISHYPGVNGAPSWSPDGQQLALVLSKNGSPKLFVLELATGTLRQVTFGPSIDTEPRWMPDGRSICFTSNRGGQPQIYQLFLPDKQIKRLTFAGNYNARPTITPDGEAMVMIHGTENGFHIAKQNLKNGQLTILTKTDLDESPSIAPNGRMIIYSTTHAQKRVLGAVSIDGRVKLLLPATQGEVQEPAWSPYLS